MDLSRLKNTVLSTYISKVKFDKEGNSEFSSADIIGKAVERFLDGQKEALYNLITIPLKKRLEIEADRMANVLDLSSEIRDSISEEYADKIDEVFKGKTVSDRINDAVDRVVEDIKRDVLHRTKSDMAEMISRRFSGDVNIGVSLKNWLERLFIGESNRLAKQMMLSFYEQSPYEKFNWILSGRHEEVKRFWKARGKWKWADGEEICEKNAKRIWTTGTLKDKYPAHPFCYDKVTEVYTKEGFKFFENVDLKDEFLSLNPVTFDLEYVKAKKYIKYFYSGKMYTFKNRSFDLLVTPDHNMFMKNRKKLDKYVFIKAKDMCKTGIQFYRSSKWVGKRINHIRIGKKSILIEDFCRLMGYYLSEGSVSKREKYKHQISIAQKKGTKKRSLMVKELKKLPYKICEGCKSFYIFDNDLGNYLSKFGKCADKYIPESIKSLDKECIKIFLEAFCLGDGTVAKGRFWKGYQFRDSRSFCTSSQKLANDIGELLIKIGHRPSYHINKVKGKTVHFANGDYVVNNDTIIITDCIEQIASIDRMCVEKVAYKDFVYDVELEKFHTLFIRRNGKVVWSGNCECRIVARVEREGPPPPPPPVEKPKIRYTRKARGMLAPRIIVPTVEQQKELRKKGVARVGVLTARQAGKLRRQNLARTKELLELQKVKNYQASLVALKERLDRVKENMAKLQEENMQLERLKAIKRVVPNKPVTTLVKYPWLVPKKLTELEKQQLRARIRSDKWII